MSAEINRLSELAKEDPMRILAGPVEVLPLDSVTKAAKLDSNVYEMLALVGF